MLDRLSVSDLYNKNPSNLTSHSDDVISLSGGGNGAFATLVAKEGEKMHFTLTSGTMVINFQDKPVQKGFKWSLSGKIYEHSNSYE